MKKILFSLTLVSLALVLALVACAGKTATSSSTSSGASSGAVSANGTPVPGGNTNQPLPLVEQLLVGTFKLEGTANAVDAKEAASLIPLWQAYSQLTASDSAAQAEINGLVTQIQGTMTPAQVNAITSMKLTQQDVLTTMGTLGFAPSSSNNSSATSTPQSSFNANGGGFAGGAPAGGAAPAGPVGGGDAGAGELLGGGAGQTSSTQVASSPARTNGIPPALLNALIELLQKRSQS